MPQQALLRGADIPFQVPNFIDDLMSDPHLLATGFIGSEGHATEGRLRTLGTSWSATPTHALRLAPRLGEHTVEVLRGAGYAEEQIQHLLRDGAAARS